MVFVSSFFWGRSRCLGGVYSSNERQYRVFSFMVRKSSFCVSQGSQRDRRGSSKTRLDVENPIRRPIETGYLVSIVRLTKQKLRTFSILIDMWVYWVLEEPFHSRRPATFARPGALPLGHVRKEPPKPQSPPHLFQSQKRTHATNHWTNILIERIKSVDWRRLWKGIDLNRSWSLLFSLQNMEPLLRLWKRISMTELFKRFHRKRIEQSRVLSPTCEFLWNSKRCGWGSYEEGFFPTYMWGRAPIRSGRVLVNENLAADRRITQKTSNSVIVSRTSSQQKKETNEPLLGSCFLLAQMRKSLRCTT